MSLKIDTSDNLDTALADAVLALKDAGFAREAIALAASPTPDYFMVAVQAILNYRTVIDTRLREKLALALVFASQVSARISDTPRMVN